MNDRSSPAEPTLEAILERGRTADRSGSRRRWIAIVALIALCAVVVVSSVRDRSESPRYETTGVLRGDLVVTVSATGTLEPVNQVDVGSELSGLIESVLVDENDRVEKDQVLARLDVSKLDAETAKSKASLAAAQARVLQADATTEEARASVERLRAVAELSGGKVPSRAEMTGAEAELARAIADAASARAAVSEARATLSADETNLRKSSIRSPIRGVVLARKVEPGQTVAASFETPVLFTIAEDLSQMELQVQVDEADVAQVKEGQSATFGVDAHPGREYLARVVRVGLGSKTSGGVVSYETILRVENDDLSLRPGMTATAEIASPARRGVLLVPNEALRFTPPLEDETKGRGFVGRLLPAPPVPARRATGAAARGTAQQVWVLRAGQALAVDVTVGATNGRFTEILRGELETGTQVITELATSTP